MGYKTYNCPIEKSCGGCELLAVPYPIQLKRKTQAMKDLFKEVALADHTEILDTLGMDRPYGYRHKAATPFAPGRHKTIQSGFYAKGTHKIIPCKQCLVEDRSLRHILNNVAYLAQKLGIHAYSEDAHRGVLRHAVVRSALYTNDILLTLVTNGKQFYKSELLVKELLKQKTRPTSIVQNVNILKTNAILGRDTYTLYGSGMMRDRILGASFCIGTTSFYQTNPQQTEVLYKTALDLAEIQSAELFMDAYCGCGTIGITAATLAPHLRVIGVERTGEAVKLARKNAQINSVQKRCHFVRADATDYMTSKPAPLVGLDVLMMDPPRAGSTEAFLRSAHELKPTKIVYVSCNPATQLRDIEFLRSLGWKLDTLVPVDMFPHTKHVETVVLMSKVNPKK